MKRVVMLLALALMAGCDGTDGAPGRDGPTGPAGKDGQDGASGLPVDVLDCAATDTGTGLWYSYQVLTYANGSREVFCAVADGADEASERRFLGADRAGAALAECAVVKDEAGAANSGWWSFQWPTTSNPNATYHDSGEASDGYVFTFANADCDAYAP